MCAHMIHVHIHERCHARRGHRHGSSRRAGTGRAASHPTCTFVHVYECVHGYTCHAVSLLTEEAHDVRSPYRPAHRRRRRPGHPDARPAAVVRLRPAALRRPAGHRGHRRQHASSPPTSPTGTRCARPCTGWTRCCTWRASRWSPPSTRSCAANIQGTYNLYEAVREEGVRRVVFASSNHAVGFTPRPQGDDPLIPITTPRRPDTFYGLSKCFGEDLAQLYADLHGIDTVSVRIGSCFPEPDDRADAVGVDEPGRRRPALPRRAHRRTRPATPSSTAAPPTPGCGGTCPPRGRWATSRRTTRRSSPPSSSPSRANWTRRTPPTPTSAARFCTDPPIWPH